MNRYTNLIQHGWAVFPCRPHEKQPWTPNGFKDATTDEEQVARWCQEKPNANVAVATGTVSGLVVLDVDTKEGRDGEATLQALEARLGPLPETVEQLTGGGGRQLFYRHPGGLIQSNVGKLGAGVDVRADGGYVIAPPSIHPDTRRPYQWEVLHDPDDMALATLPDAWIQELRALSRLPNGTAPPLPVVLEQGVRRSTLVSLAGTLRRRGLSAEEIEVTLLQVYTNRAKARDSDPIDVHAIAVSAERDWKPDPHAALAAGEASLITNPFTDLGNGERLITRYGVDLLYCNPWKRWLVWNGSWWELDDVQRVRQWAKKTIRVLYDQAITLIEQAKDAEEGATKEKAVTKTKHLLSWALKSEATARVDAMLKEAQKDCPVLPTQLDADPWLFNVQNGTLDVRTGTLLSFSRAHHMTKSSHVQYDPDTACPRWEQFLSEIMGGNEELIDFLWKAIGYTLSGSTEEECVFFLYGTGANGKSTLQRTLRALFGDYGRQAAIATFLQKRHETIGNDIAELRGARLVTAGEPDQHKRLSEAFIKSLTGRDPQRARFLFQESFEFVPQLKLWIAFNYKPIIKGTDPGIWRRVKLIPFTQKFTGDQHDPHLDQKLLAELPGILAWAMRGCQAWQEEGLPEPDAVKAATELYRSEMDEIGNWLEEQCEQHPHLRTRPADLLSDYVVWSGNKQMTTNVFGRLLTERGFRRDDQRRWVLGIGLRSQSLG
jgi:putative DNA primase/helicase